MRIYMKNTPAKFHPIRFETLEPYGSSTLASKSKMSPSTFLPARAGDKNSTILSPSTSTLVWTRLFWRDRPTTTTITTRWVAIWAQFLA